MNAYWNHKLLGEIHAEPLAWLGLMARKVYYLFNNFEQYNNKTFAVQKALSPVLVWNPLGWGVSLVLCLSGLTLAVVIRRHCAGFGFGLALAVVYAGGVVMFFVSDRFRLPLLPFLCVGAGAWGCAARGQPLRVEGRLLLAVSGAAVAASLLTFSQLWDVYDLTPAVQDYVLLSIAAEKSGADLEALNWARQALEQQATHPDALACAVQSFYNAQLRGLVPEVDFTDETWGRQAQRAAQIPHPSPGTRLIQGIALAKSGHPRAAQNILRALLREAPSAAGAGANRSVSDDALGVLLLSGLNDEGEQALAKARAGETNSSYLLVALARREKNGASLLSSAQRQKAEQAEPVVRNIFR